MSTNIVDSIVILCIMSGLVYLMYRIWTPVWSILTLVLKLLAFTIIAAFILLYFWPEGLASGCGIGSILAHLRESRALRIVWALFRDTFDALAKVDWDRLRSEWTNKTEL